MSTSTPLIPVHWDTDMLAVLDAVAIVGNVLFMEGRRREALRGSRDPDLNKLVLTAERQLLWEALRRLRQSEHVDEPVLISEVQAKYLERLEWLKGVLGADPAVGRLITGLQAEIKYRTRPPSSFRRAS